MNAVLKNIIDPHELLRNTRRVGEWQDLENALDTLIQVSECPLDTMQVMSYVQSSLMKRQSLFSDNQPMYPNIQLQCDVIDAIYEVMNSNCETENFIQRAERLEKMKIAIATIKVTI